MSKKPSRLSSTMQIAVTASSLSLNAQEALRAQMIADKEARRKPMPAHLEVRF